MWGTNANTEFQLLVIGSIIFFGVLSVQINAFDSNIGARSIFSLLIGSGIVINLFFIFANCAGRAAPPRGFVTGRSQIRCLGWRVQSQIPEIREPSLGLMIISSIILTAFFITVLMQLSTSDLKNKKISKKIGIHIRNGLYFNLIFDKMMNSLNTKSLK